MTDGIREGGNILQHLLIFIGFFEMFTFLKIKIFLFESKRIFSVYKYLIILGNMSNFLLMHREL